MIRRVHVAFAAVRGRVPAADDPSAAAFAQRRRPGMPLHRGTPGRALPHAGVGGRDDEDGSERSSFAQASFDAAAQKGRKSGVAFGYRPAVHPAERHAAHRSGEALRLAQAAARGADAAHRDDFVSHHAPLQKPPAHNDGGPGGYRSHQTDNYIPVAAAPDGIHAIGASSTKRAKMSELPVEDQARAFEERFRTRASVLELMDDDLADAQEQRLGERGTAIGRNTPLAKTVLAPLPLDSRKGRNTWNTMPPSSAAVEAEVEQRSTDDEYATTEGHYTAKFVRVALDHNRDALQHSVSIYTKKPLYVTGVFGYHDFITKKEEKAMMGELVELLKAPGVAAYQPEEGRHCVNLFERELGLATRPDEPLTFSLEESAPATMDVLRRAFQLGLIPSLPNCVQVSEYVTPWGGYKPHRKHPSIGSYIGIMSLVAPSVMVMQHVSQPWTPQLMVLQRAMYVVMEPTLFDYKLGYPDIDRATRTHQFSTRTTKDYRVELLFATIDAPRVPALAAAVKITEASEARRQSTDSSDPTQR